MILRPEKGYLLCASPRSGSTLLCDLLARTGVAGKPNSFFRPASVPYFAHDWGMAPQTFDDFGQSYIDAAIAEGSQNTGVFGMRIMWDNMQPVLARLDQSLTDTFGPLQYIHLSRTDKVAGAVSLALAAQTGLWHRNADGSERERTAPPRAPVYDHAQIATEFQGLNNEATGWTNWFRIEGIQPYTLTYEDLAADPQKALTGILAFLNCDTRIAATLSPGTARLATQRSHDWAMRFRAKAGLPPADRPS